MLQSLVIIDDFLLDILNKLISLQYRWYEYGFTINLVLRAAWDARFHCRKEMAQGKRWHMENNLETK
jgi:hypothetical protein